MVGILLDIRILLAVVKFQFAKERSFRDHPFHIIRFEVVVKLVDEPQGSPWFPCVLRLGIIQPFDEKLKIRLLRYWSSMESDGFHEEFQVIASRDVLRIRYPRIEDEFLKSSHMYDFFLACN